MIGDVSKDLSSFRDPSGTIFYKDEIVYRQINFCYEKQYRHLMDCGLYGKLTENHYIVQHEETDLQGYLVNSHASLPQSVETAGPNGHQYYGSNTFIIPSIKQSCAA